MNRSNLDLPAMLPADRDGDGSRPVGNDLASALTWQKAVFEGSRDAIFISDAAANFVLVNAAACELTGYSREELQRMKISDLHNEADLEAFERYQSRILAGEEVLSEAVIRKKDGSGVLAEFNNRSIVVAGHVYVHSAARDITQWMQAKLDLQRAKEYAENLIETANVMIIGLDAGGKVEVFNEAAEKISGYPRAEIKGRRWADTAMPKDRYPEAWEFFRALQEGDRSCGQVFDSPILTKSGEERYISWRTNEILRQGRFSGIIAFGMDITVRVRVEQALRDSEEVYRQLVELSPDGISVHHGGRILFANTAAARMLGLSDPAELIGKSIMDTVHPDDREVTARRLQALTRAGDTTPPGELRFLPVDGRVLIGGVASVALSYRGQLSVQTIVRDITERKSLEEQLRQSQRMEAIGTLAGGIAHDFNNLLTAINGYSSLILSGLNSDDPLHEDIMEIKKAGEKAAALTGQLLAFSRRQLLQTKVFSLNRVVSDLEKMLRRMVSEDIELITKLDPDLGQVKADPGQIEQVLLNIAVNARDAMPHGGRLTIRTANILIDDDREREGGGPQAGPYVLLTIGDSGCGMDADTVARIFEPFFTTKGIGKGTGLGLSTVYGIVRQSGGFIDVVSQVGDGTIFRIFLPRVDEVAGPLSESQASSIHSAGGETILLAEDDALVRALILRVLGGGYHVLEAADGLAALDISRRHNKPVHLLLTDVVMPRMSGRLLAEELKSERPELKVIYMSGYSDDVILRHCAQELTILKKPFTPHGLLQKVRQVLDS